LKNVQISMPPENSSIFPRGSFFILFSYLPPFPKKSMLVPEECQVCNWFDCFIKNLRYACRAVLEGPWLHMKTGWMSIPSHHLNRTQNSSRSNFIPTVVQLAATHQPSRPTASKRSFSTTNRASRQPTMMIWGKGGPWMLTSVNIPHPLNQRLIILLIYRFLELFAHLGSL